MTRIRFHAFLLTVCLLLAFPWGCDFNCSFGAQTGVYGPTDQIPDTEKGFEEPDIIEITAETRDIVFLWVNRDTTDESTIVGRIVAVDVPPLMEEHEIFTNSLDTDSDNDWGYFGYPAPNEQHGWPPGAYRVEIALDGAVFATKDFVVPGDETSVPPIAEWQGAETAGLRLSWPAWEVVDTGANNRIQILPPTGRGRLVEVANSRSERDVLVQMMVRESQLEVTETTPTTVCGQSGEHLYLTSMSTNIHAVLTTWTMPDPLYTGSIFTFLDLRKDPLLGFQQSLVGSIECVADADTSTGRVYPTFTPPPAFQQIPNDGARIYTLPGPTPNMLDLSYGIAGGGNIRNMSPDSWADMIRAEFGLVGVTSVEPLPQQPGTLPNRHYLIASGESAEFGAVRIVVMIWECSGGLTFIGGHMGLPTDPITTPLNWLGGATCP